MGLAFEVAPTASRSAARLRAASRLLVSAALALTGIHLLSEQSIPFASHPEVARLSGWLLVVISAAVLVTALRALATAVTPFRGRLRVDETGGFGLCLDGEGGMGAMVLHQVHILPGLILVAMAPFPDPLSGVPPSCRRTLALYRDAMPDEAWRRLNVWLRWMGRGRHDLPIGWKR